ncbi:MAG: hypothetical protein K0Q87_3899 [Neobacillus sp.]|jgi:hypothetical protein|nr:hypothetical protein [Neobacillus sp.]
MLERLKKVFPKRWKRFLFCYFFACILVIYGTDIPNLYYLIPVKATAVLVAWGMTCDNGYFGGPSFYSNLLINIIIGFILMAIVIVLIIIICSILGIDFTPFLGIAVHS